MSKAARKEDWKTLERPNELGEFDLDRRITQDEYDKIVLGFIPNDMDDKWFIFVDNNTLNLYRSWLGTFVYSVTIENTNDDYLLSKVIVNRNRDQYKFEDDDYDRQLLNDLIDYILLKKYKSS